MMSSLSTTLSRAGFEPFVRRFGRPDGSELRALYLSREVKPALDERKSKLERKVLAGVTVKLERFVQGSWVTVVTPTVGKGSADIKGLKGYDRKLFAMRFFEVAPQQRILGVFPQKDVFLALGLYDRNELDNNWNNYCKKMIAKLKAMGTSSPKCLTYDDMNKVLSNWGPPL